MTRTRIFLIALAVLLPAGEVAARIWSDVSGTSRIEAEFVELSGSIVTLKRARDGELIRVPLARLREADREFAIQAQKKLVAAQAARARRQPERRRRPPALLVAAYPTVRRELKTTSLQDRELDELYGRWRNDSTVKFVTDNPQIDARPQDLVEAALCKADELEPALRGVLNAFQQRRLEKLVRASLWPFITSPALIDYLEQPLVQEELGLTPEQLEELAGLLEGQLVATSGSGKAGFLEVEHVSEAEMNQRIAAVLTALEYRRLEQIQLQCEPSAQVARRRLAGRLKFDKGQKEMFEQRHEAFLMQAFLAYYDGPKRSASADPAGVARTLRQQSHGLVFRLLRDEQHQSWDALVGESFNLWGSENAFETTASSAATQDGE